MTNIPDPLWVIEEARAQGVDAHPNHVLFLHPGGFFMNPASMNPASMNPASMNPASMNPASMNPASMNPASMNPAWGDCCGPAAYATNAACVSADERRARQTGYRPSSARPATITEKEALAVEANICAEGVTGGPTVYVLDTGLARTDWQPMLGDAGAVRPAGADDDQPDVDGDPNGDLDCVAGHATFIAGIIKQIAPEAVVSVHRVASVLGDTEEFDVAWIIRCLPADDNTILNCSFGGSAMDDQATAIASAIRDFQARGGVVVASAGNESTHRRQYPAALRDVVSVGALGPCGPRPSRTMAGGYGPALLASSSGASSSRVSGRPDWEARPVSSQRDSPNGAVRRSRHLSWWARWHG